MGTIPNRFIMLIVVAALSLPAFSGSKRHPPLKGTNLYRRVVTNCQRIEPRLWSHPTMTVLDKRGGNSVEWVELCKQNKYLIFGIRFKYDPQGMTKDYFYPLYLEILKANDLLPLPFVVLSDNTIISLSARGENGFSVEYEYFSQ